jgi:NAD(P)-dependent dehydrogenase (short-subunit alcohol dehydrogenase family)
MLNNIAIFGASGSIGRALIDLIAITEPNATIHAYSREQVTFSNNNVISYGIDYSCEQSIKQAANIAAKLSPLDMVILATGILHDAEIMPEKSIRDLSAKKLQHLFYVNTIIPTIIGKHFIPQLDKDNRSIFAALSARVGSISDNRLGGWYAYRASKAALNMIIKNTAIEATRRNKESIIVGLHPGTVDSDLSKPFQKNVPKGKLFSPAYSAKMLLMVLGQLNPEDSGKCFAWDGKEIEP